LRVDYILAPLKEGLEKIASDFLPVVKAKTNV
jgi:hypothetical protein